jgi:glyoxylase-like metal-dependent hydrolase (beta-lactamase superfamily II)
MMDTVKSFRWHAVVLLLVGTGIPGLGAFGTQSAVAVPFTLKSVGPNVWAAIAAPASAAAGGNAGFVIGEDGVAVIDTFATGEAAQQLLTEIRKLTTLPVKFVINTHYHMDHVAGNRVFEEVGAVAIAHRNVRRWVKPENLKFFGPTPTPPQKAMIDALTTPAMGYEGIVDLHLGARQIQVRSLPGHTGGDSVVLIPDAKTAFAGDLFWRNTLPNTIDASTPSWIATLDTLAKDTGPYTYVPGHGDVGTTQDVTAFRDYLATLQKLVAAAQAQGKTGDAVVETVMPDLKAKYGQWDFFQFLSTPNIREADAELSGKKRIPR